MKVKDIIKDAMRLAGRADAAEMLEAGTDDAEVKRTQYTMTFCYNAVVDELARGYFPVVATERMSSPTGKYAFADFTYRPLKIIRVTKGDRRAEWQILPEYLLTDKNDVTVEYEYVPEAASADDDFSYPDPAVSERLIEYGMAAEYLLICGEVESANCWESKYRSEIDRLLSLRTVKERIPPRRWL